MKPTLAPLLPLAFLAAMAALLAACAPAPQRTALPAEWRPSPNFDERRPNWIILHHTSNDDAERALRTLTDPAQAVSAHYLIRRDGTLVQLVDERRRAWHAGKSYWGGDTDLNSASIGIELDNNGEEPFPEPQIATLLMLLADLTQRYAIPPAHVIGHADVAPQRKTDPSRYFPWRRLAANGFGLWCEPPYPEMPSAFDALLGLQALGYDVSDPEAAVRAFKRHFVPGDPEPVLNDSGRRLLHCLVRIGSRSMH